MEEIKVIINANVVLENDIICNGSVVIKGSRIDYITDSADLVIPINAKVIDAKGLYLGPGFVDIHVHGALEADIWDNPEKTCCHFMKHGHTTILPSLYENLDSDAMINVCNILKESRRNGTYSKIISGIYMEGPYTNANYGAAPESKKWSADKVNFNEYNKMVEAIGDFVKIWVIAPERAGVEEYIKYIKKINPNAVISVGHSEATPEEIRRLKKYGLILETHCMNATGRVGDGGGIRRCGPDEECLLDDNMYAELICDSLGIHVDTDMLKLVLKVKTKDRIILISDSTSFIGVPSERFSDATDLNFDSHSRLSGSKLTLDAACRNMIKHTGCSINDVFIMASYNPALVIGLADDIGSIAPGKIANLVFVDSNFNVKKVMFEGNLTENL